MFHAPRALLDPLNPARVRAVYDNLGFSFNGAMRSNSHLAEAFAALHKSFATLHEEESCYFRDGEREERRKCRFLDVGAGGGRHLPYYVPGQSYHVLDISPTALALNQSVYRRMRAQHQEDSHPLVTFEEVDAQRWHNTGEPFDGAIFIYSLSTMHHPRRAVRNVTAAVKHLCPIVILDYVGTREPHRPAWLTRRLLAYDPRRMIEELVGGAPLKLLGCQRFPSRLPEASLYLFRKE